MSIPKKNLDGLRSGPSGCFVPSMQQLWVVHGGRTTGPSDCSHDAEDALTYTRWLHWAKLSQELLMQV